MPARAAYSRGGLMNRYLLAGFSVFGLSTCAILNAYGQSPAPVAADAGKEPGSDPLAEVTVTGSRIARAGFDAPTPLTSLGADQLAAANPGGPVDALRQLPVLAFSTGPRGATGSAG